MVKLGDCWLPIIAVLAFLMCNTASKSLLHGEFKPDWAVVSFGCFLAWALSLYLYVKED